MKNQNGARAITRTIHWSMAVMIAFLVSIGFYMANTENHELYPLHKSLGVVAFLAIIVRVFWRVRHPWRSSAEGARNEKIVSGVHRLLIALLIIMPLSGLGLSGLGGHGVELFGLPIIPSNYNNQGVAVPYQSLMSDFGYLAHEIVAYALTLLVFLHALAAFKHHIMDRDNTLKRMLGMTE